MAIRLILGSVCLLLALHAQPAFTHAQAEPAPAPEAEAQPTGTDAEARALFMAAQVAFDEGRFESAVQYFLQAFRLSGRPELLYNIGNTYDRLQQPEEALQHFKQYLRQRPDAENRQQVEARVRLLQQALDARQQQVDAAATTPTESAPVVPTPEQTAQASAPAEPTTAPSAPAAATANDDRSGTSWVLWGGVGAVVIAAAVVAVVLASSGDTTQDPLVPRDGAPVVKL